MRVKPSPVIITLLLLLICAACERERFEADVQIPDFNFPQTVTFEKHLSAYNVFEGSAADLKKSAGFELLELSAVLFTDYAFKQRLVKIPKGTTITKSNDGSVVFPDGTILTKTFYYLPNEQEPGQGKRIIETRLEIKKGGTWNLATYVWNDTQTDATLTLDGTDTEVTWTNAEGVINSTLYHVPSQNECMTCHQSNSQIVPIGPSLLNLNRTVRRNGTEINQIRHLQIIGMLSDFPIDPLPVMVDYNDTSATLSARGRAYLAMNCAHCHNPDAWNIPAGRDFDFRHETSFESSGIPTGKSKILRNVINQKMPFIGTTMLDDQGVALLTQYIESL